MPFSLMDAGGVLRTISKLGVWDGSRLVPLKSLKVMDGATLRTVATFAPALTLSASPSSASGIAASNTPINVTTNSVTAVPTGGTGPFTYAWTVVSFTAGASPVITSSTNAATTFRQNTMTPDTTASAVFRCTVTDAFGLTATVDVPADFELISLS